MSNTRLAEFTERNWDTLIDYIGQGRVVPIVGPELLVAHEGSECIPFYEKVTQKLSTHLEFPFRPGETFDEFLHRFLRENNTVKMARMGLTKVLKEMSKEEQPVLKKLVSIPAFKLFLSTTPDNLLANTLKDCGADPDVYFFSTNFRQRIDLPFKDLSKGHRYVYHLYGKANPCINYAVSEDERLDYSCCWMDEGMKPKNLLSLLSDKYLLILGCGYENWLARFFLYGLKGQGLFSNVQDESGLLADSHPPEDGQLNRFLSRCRGYIYYEGGALDFVEELGRRMQGAPVLESDDNGEEFESGSIFISYASEDRSVALKVKQCLESYNLPVWMDKFQLKSGDAYDEKIARNIKNSSLFLPILSKTTATVTESRYFRKEWVLASDVAMMRSPKVPFIHPIAIDSVAPCDNIPEFINQRHWITAPDGVLAAEDVDRLRELIVQS